MTLYRFFVLHFTIPFFMFGLSMFHISCLHEFGSNNKKGIPSILDFIMFSPYYTLKDTLSVYFSFLVLSIIIFFLPDILSHSLNYEIANILVTPAHIVPEWYF